MADLALRSVSLLFQVYLAGTIGAEGMGKMQLVLTAGGFAMTLGTSGVRVAAMNLTAQECGRNHPAGIKKAICSSMLYGLILSMLSGALLLFAAPKIAIRFVRDEAVTPALRLLGVSLPFHCLVAVLSGYFTARGKVRTLVAIEILERIVSIAATVLLLRFWADGEMSRVCSSVIGGGSISLAFSLILLGSVLFRDLRSITGSKAVPMRKRLLELCVPLALSDYLRSGLSTLEQFLIPRGLSRSPRGKYTAMADYGTISGMVFPVLMFPAALFYSLSDLLVPELSRCRVQGKVIRIRSICVRCLKTGVVFAAMVAGLTYLLGPSLGRFLYKSETAGRYLQIFAPLILMLYLDALTDGMLKGLGEQVASVRYNTITAAADVILLYFLLPRWGIGGFVCSFTLTHAVNFWLSLRRLMTVTGCNPDWKHALKTVAVAILTTAAAVRLVFPIPRLYSMILCGGVFLGMYFLVSLSFGTFHPRQLRQFLPHPKANRSPPRR